MYTYTIYKSPEEQREWIKITIRDYQEAGLYDHAAYHKTRLKKLEEEYDFPLMKFKKAGEELVDNLNLIFKQ